MSTGLAKGAPRSKISTARSQRRAALSFRPQKTATLPFENQLQPEIKAYVCAVAFGKNAFCAFPRPFVQSNRLDHSWNEEFTLFRVLGADIL
jgi:hypothetical protein